MHFEVFILHLFSRFEEREKEERTKPSEFTNLWREWHAVLTDLHIGIEFLAVNGEENKVNEEHKCFFLWVSPFQLHPAKIFPARLPLCLQHRWMIFSLVLRNILKNASYHTLWMFAKCHHFITKIRISKTNYNEQRRKCERSSKLLQRAVCITRTFFA